MMRPGADPIVIYRVNRAMDNPDPWSIRMYQTRKKSGYYSHVFDVPGLRINGHRAPNHNWMSAMMTGYMNGGKEGMYAAAANYLMQDLMSDALVRTVGYARRDLFESMLNYGLVNHSFRKRRRRRSVRRRARAPPRRGERNHLAAGRRTAVIDMVPYKLYATILIYLEYPPHIEPFVCL
jgi:hypothetical protein